MYDIQAFGGDVKRGKKSLRRKLVEQADKVFSLLVRALAKKEYNGICPFCKERPIECCFHFVTRAKHIVRWDLTNAVGSCNIDNYKMEWNPHPYIKWYLDKFGLEAYENLVLRSNRIAKFNTDELENIIKSCEDKLRDMGEDK